MDHSQSTELDDIIKRLNQLLNKKTALQFKIRVDISFELDLDNWGII